MHNQEDTCYLCDKEINLQSEYYAIIGVMDKDGNIHRAYKCRACFEDEEEGWE